tara:strand:+ start:537 stop:1313 length:777 start_codon:yes stop_codon:yes gene_type:complete
MSIASAAGNIYFAYQFLTKLTKPFKDTDAYRLGIIDEKGKVLKRRSTLKTREEKEAYTVSDTLVFNLKKLLEKVPGGRTRFASFAAALFLLKEDLEYRHYHDLSFLQEEFYKYMKIKESEINYLREQIETRSEYLSEIYQEELSAGSGAIAGIGVPNPSMTGQAEPAGITYAQRKKKRKKFAGTEVFEVDPEVFMKARFGKKKYDKYENYVGNDDIGQEIRQYGRSNPGKSIIIQDSLTGAMLFLKKGKEHERLQGFY